MSILKEFKEFALKGTVVDLAVGVIIGVAFGKVVTSVVNDIIMPPIGRIMGGVNINDLLTCQRRFGNQIPRSGQGSRNGRHRLRLIRQHTHRLHHCRFLHLHDRQSHEPAEKETRAGRCLHASRADEGGKPFDGNPRRPQNSSGRNPFSPRV